ncbi:hypothetical protein BG006_003671 [Podila minutissima]|uniref:Uncharacterized protein n=1 Tax=Podila minutissima TaxID=64525 RepID=A0A9P5VN44_9FUNG|nr:hypothetical protein BG006_003671 [Podila minutissima]
MIFFRCPAFVNLYLDGGQILIELEGPFDITMSLKLNPAGHLEPELGDHAKALKLESLSIKQCQVPQDAMIEELTISTWLRELALVIIRSDLP